ncbi:MAG: c-type cytochrome [Terracidiphilus sp.]
MLKSLLVAAVAAVLAASLSFADQSESKVVIPVNKTSPADGKQMYTSYCAPCHGVDAKGRGPAAPALKAPPTDLTELQKNNHGKFPDTHVMAILEFGADVPAHGSATMPVWGPILGNMNRLSLQDKQLRISNLSRYLESIQTR